MSVFELASATIPISIEGMQKLGSDLNAIKEQLASKLGGGLMSGLGMLGIATGIGATVAMAVKRAMDSAEKLSEMKATLAATGQEVNSSIAHFKELAASINLVTGTSKGQVMGLIEQSLKMGKTSEEAQRLSTTALGLSKRLGIDSKEALELLSRGDERALTALGRHSSEIAKATTQQEKLDAINRVSAEGIKMLAEHNDSSAGKWERIQAQIGSLYTKFGELLLPIVNKVIGVLSGLFEWITTLSGACSDFEGESSSSFSAVGEVVSWLGDIFSSIFAAIGRGIEIIIYSIKNWRLSFEMAGTYVALCVVTMGERIVWFGKQIPIVLGWVWENWKDIFTDIGNFVATIFTNMAKNLKSIWSGVVSFVKGEGFKPNLTPLTNGFKSAIKKMPELTKFEHSGMGTALESQFNELKRKYGEGLGKFDEQLEKHKPNKAAAQKIVDANLGIKAEDMNAKPTKKGGSFEGLADYWKKAQEKYIKK